LRIRTTDGAYLRENAPHGIARPKVHETAPPVATAVSGADPRESIRDGISVSFAVNSAAIIARRRDFAPQEGHIAECEAGPTIVALLDPDRAAAVTRLAVGKEGICDHNDVVVDLDRPPFRDQALLANIAEFAGLKWRGAARCNGAGSGESACSRRTGRERGRRRNGRRVG
jgi:hypothetical protein